MLARGRISDREQAVNALRWAVIGAGRFGRIHATALATLPGVALAALSRRDPAKLRDAAAELGVSRTYTDYRRLLADPEIDVVTVATHWREHHDIARDALAAGKHVLLEKPMAANYQECRSLVEAAAASTSFLMVGHVCRFDPRVTMARQAILDGRLGRIISMHARRNLPLAPGSLRLDKISPLMGDGIHDADLMLWFSGQLPSRIYARNLRVEQFTYPDIGWAMLEFGDQALGMIETNWRLPPHVPTTIDARFEVIGTEGTLEIDCSRSGLSVLDRNGLRYPDTGYWPRQHDRTVGALMHELAYFRDCIQSGKPPAVITPRESAQAVALMELAEQSAAAGHPVEVPRTLFALGCS